jgi:hypothetical protein
VRGAIKMKLGKEFPEFLRQREMQELIASEKDPITAHLMTFANNTLLSRLLTKEKGPVADFDLRYFMEVIQEFASDHETLKKILDGKVDELMWMADK